MENYMMMMMKLLSCHAGSDLHQRTMLHAGTQGCTVPVDIKARPCPEHNGSQEPLSMLHFLRPITECHCNLTTKLDTFRENAGATHVQQHCRHVHTHLGICQADDPKLIHLLQLLESRLCRNHDCLRGWLVNTLPLDVSDGVEHEWRNASITASLGHTRHHDETFIDGECSKHSGCHSCTGTFLADLFTLLSHTTCVHTYLHLCHKHHAADAADGLCVAEQAGSLYNSVLEHISPGGVVCFM